jgi:GNAT superfamily N-acetyltransferase
MPDNLADLDLDLDLLVPRPRPAPAGPDPAPEAIQVRSLRPGQEEVVRRVLGQVSDEGRFQRFHTPTPRLTAGLVRALASAEEGTSGAVVAYHGDHPVGHAQWTRHPYVSLQAEAAVVVADAYQGVGIARRLMAALAEICRCHGVTELACHVHHENRRVREALHRRGARRAADGVLVLSVDTMLADVPSGRMSGSCHESGGTATRDRAGVR